MSGKRPGDKTGAPEGARQFKQTKLDFFTSASRGTRRQETANAQQKPDDCPTTTTTNTEEEEEEEEVNVKPEQQNPNTDETQTTPSPPPPASTSAITTTATTISSKPGTQPTKSTSTTTTPPPSKIHITDKTGDLFTPTPLIPTNPSGAAVLIHACNAVGSWGGGIALAFRDRYPAAFRLYRAHCARAGSPDALLGTALLIPPQVGDAGRTGKGGGGGGGGGSGIRNSNGHYIGCLFTSRRYGRARDKPERILRATGPAMRHLMRLIVEEEERVGGEGVVIGEVRMCRINSGLFAVPWAQSKRVIEELELGEGEVPRCVEDGVLEVVAYERA